MGDDNVLQFIPKHVLLLRDLHRGSLTIHSLNGGKTLSLVKPVSAAEWDLLVGRGLIEVVTFHAPSEEFPSVEHRGYQITSSGHALLRQYGIP
jgi:hypothetical protein